MLLRNEQWQHMSTQTGLFFAVNFRESLRCRWQNFAGICV